MRATSTGWNSSSSTWKPTSGRSTSLVTNTGGPPRGGPLDNSIEEWEAAYRSLVLGVRVLVEAVLPGMRERGWGRIVNVGSNSTVEPIPTLAISNSVRQAAVGFLKTLSREVAADGVTVNTVVTGKFATDRLAENEGSLENAERSARETVPAGRLGLPEEFGDLVAFLASGPRRLHQRRRGPDRRRLTPLSLRTSTRASPGR